jgi:D-inositol-3-phosphate glycosyltransferase
MACGTPVVASEVGGLAFLIQDGITGYHFPAEDPVALSNRLISLIEDESLRKKMSKNAAEVATEYDWDIIAARIGRLYEDVKVG